MNIRTLSTYVLRALARAQIEGRRSNLETLRDELSVRRTDIRAAVSQLHRERMLDVLTMRLTLAGLAVGHSLANAKLPPLRQAVTAASNDATTVDAATTGHHEIGAKTGIDETGATTGIDESEADAASAGETRARAA